MLKRFWSKPKRIDADYELQRVCIDGQEISLPRKPLCVLLALLRAAPDSKSRKSLINDVWNGNFLVGEKGLTQALWTIRGAIQKAGGNPKWIRTVVRFGYRWVGPAAETVQSKIYSPTPRRRSQISAGLAVVAIFAASASTFGYLHSANTNEVQRIVASNGSIALLNHRAVMVADHQGRHVNFLVTPPTVMRSAAFSTDGNKIFITVSNGDQCQMRIFEFDSQRMENYDSCAHGGAGAI